MLLSCSHVRSISILLSCSLYFSLEFEFPNPPNMNIGVLGWRPHMLGFWGGDPICWGSGVETPPLPPIQNKLNSNTYFQYNSL